MVDTLVLVRTQSGTAWRADRAASRSRCTYSSSISHSIIEHGMKNLLEDLMRAADLLARRLGRIWVAGISQRITLT